MVVMMKAIAITTTSSSVVIIIIISPSCWHGSEDTVAAGRAAVEREARCGR